MWFCFVTVLYKYLEEEDNKKRPMRIYDQRLIVGCGDRMSLLKVFGVVVDCRAS